MVGVVYQRELFLLQNIVPPVMVNLIHKLPELQSPQPPHLTGPEERLSKQLLKIPVVFIVQTIHYREEITSKVLVDPDHLICHSGPGTDKHDLT